MRDIICVHVFVCVYVTCWHNSVFSDVSVCHLSSDLARAKTVRRFQAIDSPLSLYLSLNQPTHEKYSFFLPSTETGFGNRQKRVESVHYMGSNKIDRNLNRRPPPIPKYVPIELTVWKA